VNPIDFENAEGNLGIASANLIHLAAKLPVSRLQRDLSDSTALRALGVPLGHAYLALGSCLKGLGKLRVAEANLSADLEANWAVVAEGIQTVLRREAYPNPYEALKALTRTGKPASKDDIRAFVDALDVPDAVKAELRANHMVQVEMTWALPSPDDRVEYDLWTTPSDLVSRDFQKSFKDVATALGDRAYFTPHMYIYDGIKSGCQGPDGENQCYNLCTNNGRYCATDPDNDLDKGISGADVVEESLRRTCIWHEYGKENGVGSEWWDYVNEFMFRCDNEDYFASKECVNDCLAHAKIDKAVVKKCMKDSGGTADDNPNEILENELAAKDAAGVVILPATFVNGAAIRGALEFAVIFKAICSGYVAGSEPDVCTKCANCPNEHSCVMNGSCHGASAQGSVSNSVFLSSLVGLSLFFSCVGFIQWRRSQNQVREQVKGILAEYMPIDKQNQDDDLALTEEDAEFS